MYLTDAAVRASISANVGKVTDVNTVLLRALCEDGFIPVVAPVALARPAPAADSDEPPVWKLTSTPTRPRATSPAALKAEKTHHVLGHARHPHQPRGPAVTSSTLTRRRGSTT